MSRTLFVSLIFVWSFVMAGGLFRALGDTGRPADWILFIIGIAGLILTVVLRIRRGEPGQR